MIKRKDIAPAVLYLEEENIVLKSESLNEADYAKALSSLVIVTVDILIYDSGEGKIFLAKRHARPLKGERWFIGGRVYRGESLEVAAARIFKRETGRLIDPKRLKFISLARYFFKDKEQEPQNEGSDSLSFTFGLEMNAKERDGLSNNLDKAEYEVEAGLEEFNLKTLHESNLTIAVIEAAQKILS